LPTWGRTIFSRRGDRCCASKTLKHLAKQASEGHSVAFSQQGHWSFAMLSQSSMPAAACASVLADTNANAGAIASDSPTRITRTMRPGANLDNLQRTQKHRWEASALS